MKAIRQSGRCVALISFAMMASIVPTFAAGSEADFKSAYASAEAANQQAGALRDQWTATASALDAAKKAAAAGDFDSAIAQSKEAEALAKASIDQATSEKTAWKALELR